MSLNGSKMQAMKTKKNNNKSAKKMIQYSRMKQLYEIQLKTELI